MRRVVYYTVRGSRTPHLEDALIIGLDRVALIEVPNEMAKPSKRMEALYNLKNGIKFN